VRELISTRKLDVWVISFKDQIADIITKGLFGWTVAVKKVLWAMSGEKSCCGL
jgi:hypothetical protein